MTTAVIYALIAVVVYMVLDTLFYLSSAQFPNKIFEDVVRINMETDPAKAGELAVAALQKLHEWDENELKMEYKAVWTASRFSKTLALVKNKHAETLPQEIIGEFDDLIGKFNKAVPRYFETLARAIVIAVLLALVIRAFVIQAFKIPSGSMIPTLEVGDQLLVTKFTYGLDLPFSNKRLLKIRKPRHGDIVVFKPPRSVMSSWIEHEIKIPFSNKVVYKWSSQVDFIKRIVGLPGDKVELKAGTLYINDKPSPLVSEGKFGYERASESYARNVDAWLFTEYIDGKPHKVLYSSDNLESENAGPYAVGPGEFFAMGDNRDDSADSRTWVGDPAHIEDIRGKALIIHFSWDQIKNRPRLGRMGRLIR